MRFADLTVATIMLAMSDAAPAATCGGDCNADGQVAVNELVRAVSIALGSAPAGDCTAVDSNADGTVTVAELIGAVNSLLNGCGATSVTPTPTPTSRPDTTATPFIPGCDNGQVSFTYSDVAATNAVTTPLQLRLVAAAETRDARTGSYVWQLNALECLEGVQFSRSLQIQFIGVTSPFAAGVSVEVKPFGSLPIALINYGELQDPNVYLRSWSPTSGTLTIDAVDGDRVEFSFVGAMQPQPLTSFGQVPNGTFTLDASGVIEHLVRQ